MLTGVVGLSFCLVFLVVAIFYLLTLSKALAKCSPATRTMQPAMVWLLLIPLFNLIWNFLVVMALAKSLGAEFKARNIPEEALPGQTIGMAMAVCTACSIIPLINFIAAPVQFVLWIVYWVKIAGFSSKLSQAQTVPGVA